MAQPLDAKVQTIKTLKEVATLDLTKSYVIDVNFPEPDEAMSDATMDKLDSKLRLRNKIHAAVNARFEKEMVPEIDPVQEAINAGMSDEQIKEKFLKKDIIKTAKANKISARGNELTIIQRIRKSTK